MAKSRKNKRIWKWLLGAAVVSVVVGLPTAYFGGRYYLKQRTLGWKNDGLAAAAAGNNEKAADLLGRYIRRNNDDPVALEAFINAREQVELPNGQHIAETAAALKMMLGLQPNRIDLREHLLKLYVRIQRRPEAMDAANAILAKIPEVLKTETDPEKIKKLNDIKSETLGLKVVIQIAMQEDRDALNTAQLWADASTNKLQAQMMQIDIRLHLRQSLDTIVKELQKQAEANPADAASKVLLGYALLHAGEQHQPEASMWLHAAAKDLDPHSELVPVLVGQFDAMGVAGDAISVLQDLVNRGADAGIRRTLACRYWEQGQWQKSVDLLGDVNPADTKSDPTLLALKEIAFVNLDRKDDAAACRTALGQMKSSVAQAWLLIIPRVTRAAEVDDKKIIETCQRALVLNPQDAYLHYFLGESYARVHELGLAVDAWNQATILAPTWSAPASRLIEGLIQQGKPEAALSAAATARRRNPASISGTIAYAHAWASGIESGDVAQADELLNLVDKVQAAVPGETKTLLIRIQLLGRAGKKAEAITATRTAMTANPAPDESVFVNLVAISRKFSLGIEDEILTAAEKKYGLTPTLEFARAVNRFLMAEADSGLKAFDLAAASKDRKGEAYAWKLARARYLDVISSPDAAAAWEALGNEFPQQPEIQFAITSARAVVGNWAIMSQAVDRLRTCAPTGEKSLEWRLAQARMYIQCAHQEEDYAKGALLLNGLIKDYRDKPEPHVLLARALVHMNRIDGALEQLQIAELCDPSSVPIALELAGLLQSRGEFERVQTELDRIAPQLHSESERLAAADSYARAGATEKALALIDQTKGSSTIPHSGLFKAMLLLRKGDIENAEAAVKPLMEKPDLETVQFAASLYLSEGKKAEAEKALGLLDGLKLEPALKELIWGAYYLQTGNYAEATSSYQAAVKKAPENPVTWRTLSAVNMVLGKKDEAITAIRNGSQAVPGDKGLESELKQVDLIRESLDDPGLLLVVLAYHRNPVAGDAPLEMMKLVNEARRTNDLNRLAAQLQQFTERHADFMPAYVRLAQCFSDMKRPGDALSAAQHAMTAFPNDAEPARIAAQIAGSAQRWSEMRAAAESWKKRSNDPNADVLLAQALSGLGQFEAARTQLRPYLASAKAKPDQFAGFLSVYASATVNLGQQQEAIDLLWPLAQKDANWRSAWVNTALLFRDARVTLAWLEKVDAAIPADAPTERLGIAEAYDILGRREKNQQWIQKATELTTKIAEQAPNDVRVQLTAAAQAERAGDLKAAEPYYRRVLKMEPTNWIANNNLAMVVLRRSGDPKEAVALAQAGVKSQPRTPNIYDTLAFAQYKSGDPKSAVATLQTALNLTPDNLSYQIRLAQYLFDSGKQTEAITKIREIDQSGRPTTSLDDETKAVLEDLRKRIKA